MRLIVNGKETEIEDEATLEKLLDLLKIAKGTKGIAVAVNDTVVPRDAWPGRTLHPGDTVEIIRAVQGG